MPDTPIFTEAKEKGQLERIPFFSIFKPPALWTFLQVLVLMTGLFFAVYSMYDFAVGIYTRAGLPEGLAAFYYGIAGIIEFVANIVWGLASDFLGRKPVFIISAIVSAVLAVPAYYLVYYSAVVRSVPLLVLGAFLMGFLSAATWGLVPVYLSERFATQRRGSGVGFGYSSGIFLSAWMPLYSIPLYGVFYFIEGTNIWFTAAFWLILGSIIYGIAAAIGPETIGIDLRIVKER
jgi:MFS family permease